MSSHSDGRPRPQNNNDSDFYNRDIDRDDAKGASNADKRNAKRKYYLNSSCENGEDLAGKEN